MQKDRHFSFLSIVILSLLGLTQCGCEQQLESNAPVDVEPATTTSGEDTKSDPGKPDLSETSSEVLVRKADGALAAKDIETVIKIMGEFQKRDNVSPRFKMEAARILFGAGDMKNAAKLYDEILEVRPEIKPQLWQRGLALYYAEEFEKGVDQFDTHQTFNSQDVENSVWHMLCQSRLTSVDEARKGMIKIEQDTRIPMKQVFDMFAGAGTPQEVLDACGYEEGKQRRDSSIYHGLLYVGLFHEMMGDQEASNESMKEALGYKPHIAGLMGHVAEGHLRARKAYPTDND